MNPIEPSSGMKQSSPSKSRLSWHTDPRSLIHSSNTELNTLTNLKNVVLELRRTWPSQIAEGIQGEAPRDIEKRLQLLQNQIQGLLKRRIDYTDRDQRGAERVLDYSALLKDKQDKVIDLERKIQSLEEKLRRSLAREKQLQNQLAQLSSAELERKEEIIALKTNSAIAEVAVSTAYRDALNRFKRNVEMNRFRLGESEKLIFEGVNIPDVAEVGSLDIKPDSLLGGLGRSRVYQQQPDNLKYRTRLVQFFREFERLSNQQSITDFEVERIIEGFLNNMPETKLYQKMQLSIQNYRNMQNYRRLQQNFAAAAGLFADFVSQLTRDNINYRLPGAVDNIFRLLQDENVVAIAVNGAVVISPQGAQSHSGPTKVTEVPVQPENSKHLIHVLSHELKRLFEKYPKLQSEIDPKIAQYLQQEVLDQMQADSVQKLINIVRYVPQIVKVDNVYDPNSQKQRKKQFYQRVLNKILLEELEKLQKKTGLTLEVDEAVLAMIKSQLKDVVSTDDILRMFNVVPRYVEVEKIVQKIVEKVVQVPKVITVEKIVQKIVQVEKIKEVDRIINVPIETPMLVQTERERLVPVETRIETVVEVPTVVEKLVEMQREVSKIIEVEVFRDKIVEVDRPVEIESVVNHIQMEYQQVEVIKEKIVPVETIIEKIVEVPVYVEKIVERVVEIPKIIQIQKVVEKIVPVVEYRSAREVQNHIEVRYQVVDRIVEKIVAVPQYRDRIVQVPQRIEVIKQANNVVTEIKEVEVIREKLVIQEKIKEVERLVTRVIEVPREVIKDVERVVEVPILREVFVIRELVVEKPVISRVQSVHIKEVVVREPFIIKEPVIVEVQKFINVYIEVPKTIRVIEEKIVEVPVIRDRIKEVRVIVEKIIEKMVEVPKVVEVQKIVEKIVVVPRVVEKVVEVPQIIEKIIEKEVIREVIREVFKEVQVPVIQERIKEVEIIKNVYIQIEKAVDRIVEKTVRVPEIQQRLVTTEYVREVPMIQRQEVPRNIYVDKIVPQIVECVQTVEVERQIIVPIEIPVPVNLVEEKIVQVRELKERLVSVPQIIEKIVKVKEESVQVVEVEKVVERILIEKQIQEIEKIVPYFNEVIKEVPTIIQKLVPVETKVEQIVIAQQVIEKVIEKTNLIAQIHEVQKIREKLVEVPKLVEIERIIPQIIRVNQYIQKIAEKIVQVPIIIENLKEVMRERQKVVAINTVTTEIVQVEREVEKLVYAEKLKEVVRNVNYIEKVLQIIDRLEQVPVAVTTTEEKFIEVPYIIEKIVEKIIIMPQIVEVLKYVHDVCQVDSPGVAVPQDFGQHEAKYKHLTKNIETQLDGLTRQLQSIRDPAARRSIETIDKFLQELRQFILVPRIIKVVEQKIVEKQVPTDRIVKVAAQDQEAVKRQLSLSILVEKLIAQLRRVKQTNLIDLQLDEDIKLIFFADLNSQIDINAQMQQRLDKYREFVQRQFQALGNWTADHQFMLNTFLQQRFLMAELIQNANKQIARAREDLDQQNRTQSKYQQSTGVYSHLLDSIASIVSQNRPPSEIIDVLQQYDSYRNALQAVPNVPSTSLLSDAIVNDQRIQALLREKDSQINQLRQKLLQVERKLPTESRADYSQYIASLQAQIEDLHNENRNLISKASQSGLVDSFRQQIRTLQARNIELQGQISNYKNQQYNLQSKIKSLMQQLSFKKDSASGVYSAQQQDPLSASQSQTRQTQPNYAYRASPNIQSPFTTDYPTATEGLGDPSRFPSRNLQMSSIPMTESRTYTEQQQSSGKPNPNVPADYYTYGTQGARIQQAQTRPTERQGSGDAYSGRSSGIVPGGTSLVTSYRPQGQTRGGNLGQGKATQGLSIYPSPLRQGTTFGQSPPSFYGQGQPSPISQHFPSYAGYPPSGAKYQTPMKEKPVQLPKVTPSTTTIRQGSQMQRGQQSQNRSRESPATFKKSDSAYKPYQQPKQQQ